MALNYVAVLAAAVISLLAGAVWYGIFGPFWIAALGWKQEDLPRTPPLGPVVTSLLAEVTMAAALSTLLSQLGLTDALSGVILGAGCWLAFMATTICINNAYERRPLVLGLIDGGHWLVVMLLQGFVIGHFAT